jgi:hypothetical protein
MTARRRFSLPIVLAVACSAPVFVQAAPAEVKWYSGVNCENKALTSQYPLPDALSREALVRALLGRALVTSETELEFACNVFGKPWKSQDQATLVVFVETSLFHRTANGKGASESNHQLRIGVYRQQPQGRYDLVAKTSRGVDFRDQADVSSLDFAPYKLTPSEYAFGVRMSRNYMYGGGGGTNVYLDLYRVQASDVRPVLSTLMSSSSMTAGDWHKNGTRDHSFNGDDRTAEISVLTTTTGGVFDWRKKKGRKFAVFKWTGEDFQTRGRDPVEDVNVD